MTVAALLQHKGSEIASVRPDDTIGTVVRVLTERSIGAVVVLDPAARRGWAGGVSLLQRRYHRDDDRDRHPQVPLQPHPLPPHFVVRGLLLTRGSRSFP